MCDSCSLATSDEVSCTQMHYPWSLRQTWDPLSQRRACGEAAAHLQHAHAASLPAATGDARLRQKHSRWGILTYTHLVTCICMHCGKLVQATLHHVIRICGITPEASLHLRFPQHCSEKAKISNRLHVVPYSSAAHRSCAYLPTCDQLHACSIHRRHKDGRHYCSDSCRALLQFNPAAA